MSHKQLAVFTNRSEVLFLVCTSARDLADRASSSGGRPNGVDLREGGREGGKEGEREREREGERFPLIIFIHNPSYKRS